MRFMKKPAFWIMIAVVMLFCALTGCRITQPKASRNMELADLFHLIEKGEGVKARDLESFIGETDEDGVTEYRIGEKLILKSVVDGKSIERLTLYMKVTDVFAEDHSRFSVFASDIRNPEKEGSLSERVELALYRSAVTGFHNDNGEIRGANGIAYSDRNTVSGYSKEYGVEKEYTVYSNGEVSFDWLEENYCSILTDPKKFEQQLILTEVRYGGQPLSSGLPFSYDIDGDGKRETLIIGAESWDGLYSLIIRAYSKGEVKYASDYIDLMRESANGGMPMQHFPSELHLEQKDRRVLLSVRDEGGFSVFRNTASHEVTLENGKLSVLDENGEPLNCLMLSYTMPNQFDGSPGGSQTDEKPLMTLADVRRISAGGSVSFSMLLDTFYSENMGLVYDAYAFPIEDDPEYGGSFRLLVSNLFGDAVVYAELEYSAGGGSFRFNIFSYDTCAVLEAIRRNAVERETGGGQDKIDFSGCGVPSCSYIALSNGQYLASNGEVYACRLFLINTDTMASAGSRIVLLSNDETVDRYDFDYIMAHMDSVAVITQDDGVCYQPFIPSAGFDIDKDGKPDTVMLSRGHAGENQSLLVTVYSGGEISCSGYVTVHPSLVNLQISGGELCISCMNFDTATGEAQVSGYQLYIENGQVKIRSRQSLTPRP